MEIPNNARILELGCGTGHFWITNKNNINPNWSITLSDFSTGMLQSAKDGYFYATANSCESMVELNDLVEKFDVKMDLHNNGFCHRFDLENGEGMLKKYFNEVKTEILEGKIIVEQAETIVSYKASTIKGTS